MNSAEQVERLLARIAEVDPLVNAICTVNPRALEQAAALDAERAAGRVRGPLHGRPVLVKDNVDTADLPTTAGSLALAGIAPPAADATVVRRLRDAGCVILGKTNLSEWANMRGHASISGWSAYGGQTRNPYGLDRSPSGSSSGSAAAVAARLAPLAIGTETNGSIVSPAALNGVVGIKPTVGLVPQHGIVPISHSQDTAGPMALSVPEAARALTVMSGGAADYAAICAADGAADLTGVRIGVPRGEVWGHSPKLDQATEQALSLLSASGATVVDDLALPEIPGFDPAAVVLLHELKEDLEAYLRTRPGAPQTLDALIEFNRQHADTELRYFGQEHFERAARTAGLEAPEYLEARRALLRIGRDGIDNLLREHDLDTLVLPGRIPASPIDRVNGDLSGPAASHHAAYAGYPLVSVPSGVVGGLPVAVSFSGTAHSEATLVRVANAFELARVQAQGPFPEPTLRRETLIESAAGPTMADRPKTRDVAHLAFAGQAPAGAPTGRQPSTDPAAPRSKTAPPKVELT